MSYTYAVVVVTYNRLDLLKECLEHIVNQTVSPTAVVVIDNFSSDGTYEYLEQNYSENPLFVIVHEKENTGGAGGFCTGIKTAMKTPADWFMLIDDDAILDYDCMEKLSPDPFEEHMAYACSVIEHGSIATNHRRDDKCAMPEENYNQPEFPCKYATFCGLMINRSLVQRIGYPENQYFIWYDDTEYSMRINKYTDIYVRSEAKLNHKTKPEPVMKGHKKATWKRYYGVRNNIHALKKHRKWWHLAKTIRRDIIIIIKLVRSGIDDPTCITEAKLYGEAVKDGLRGRLGKNPKYMPGQVKK